MTTHNTGIVLLAIRGALKTTVLDDARKIHNETAGNPQGVAAARALGDLSHNVFVPLQDASEVASELLILDLWNSVDGLQKFFSDPQVQAGGDMIFKTRDPVVWQDAGIQSYALPTPRGRNDRFVGTLRGTVKSRDAARRVMDGMVAASINAARMKGQVSHQFFWRLSPPDQPESLEVIGVDVWMDGDGMKAFYGEGNAKALYETFAAPPVASLWKQPAGQWVEW